MAASTAADRVLIDAREPAEILLEVIASMTEAASVDVALHRLARLALRATGGDRCAILVREGRDRMVPAAAATLVGDPSDQWHRFREMQAIELGSSFERQMLLQTEEIVTIEDVASSSMIPAEWREWGSRSVALAPVRLNDETFGILAIEHVRSMHTFSTSEIELLRSIASAASLALRDAKLLEQVRKHVLLEQQLNDCIPLLLSGRSVREILGSIADAFHTLLPETAFSINLVSADRASFRPVAWRGSRPARQSFSFSDLPRTDVDAIRDRWRADPERPIRIDDLKRFPEWRDILPELDVGVLVPLTDGTTVIGWIAAGRRGEPFTTQELRVARVFAGYAALAVSQASLRDSIETRARVVDALFALGDRAGRASDPRRLIQALNRELTPSIGIRCVRLAVSGELLAQALRVPIANPAERRLLTNWRSNAEPVVDGAKLALPVRVGRRVAGVLWLDTSGTPDPVTLTLASAVATAIGDVASKTRLRRRSERRSLELALAKERERIAHDLHDTVGQIFYSIGLRLHDAATKSSDPGQRASLDELRGQAATGMHEVRASVYAQSVLKTDRAGLAASIREMAQRFSLATGTDVDLRIDAPLGRTAPEVSHAFTRIVHEIFVNVERHARAQIVTVTLRAEHDALVLIVRDDGVGLPHRGTDGWRGDANFGMRSMAKSVRDLGGTFEVRQAEPVGLEVRVRIPRRNAAR